MSTPYAYTLGRADRICLALVFCSLAGWEFTKGIWPHRQLESWPQKFEAYPGMAQPAGVGAPAPFTLHAAGPQDPAPVGMAIGQAFGPRMDAGLEPEVINSFASPVDIQDIDLGKASQDELQAAGFPRHVASNIVKYRAAGGQLRDSAALLRIYGMDQGTWGKVKANVQFPEKGPIRTSSGTGPILDLNTATAAELETLPGIGPGRANAIIKFRSMLGGFHATSQLRECYSLTPETADAILPYLVIRSAPARLFVNRTRLDTLYHPYVNRKVLRVLESYKRQHGHFKDPDDLRRAYPPDTAWIGRLLPYLDFSLDETVSVESDPSMER